MAEPVIDAYVFPRDALALLLTRTWFPERTGRESTIILDFLKARGELYDRFEFSVRCGAGQVPDPALPANVQRGIVYSSRKRIDMIVWQGEQSTIIEVKERLSPAVLGQLLTYQQLLLEDRPGIKTPALACIGRFFDDDTMRVLNGNGIDAYVYPPSE